ncbi:hypothetical protein FRX31_018529, partial [Thalictrum thalictroides]
MVFGTWQSEYHTKDTKACCHFYPANRKEGRKLINIYTTTMAIASSQQAFLTNALISTHKIRNPTTTISCKCSMNNDHESP